MSIYIYINVLKRDRDNLNTRPKEAVSEKKLTGFINTKKKITTESMTS